MKKVGIIPARLESNRLPEKLLYSIGEKTLLQRTYENARKCSDLDELFIATDHVKIQDHAQQFGAKVIMTESCKNGTERIAKAVESASYLKTCEYVLNIQGDHPVIAPETISSLIKTLESNEDADMSTAVIPLVDFEKISSPNIVKCVFDNNHNAIYFSRSPIPFSAKQYYQHLGIYAFRKEFLLKIPTLKNTPLQQAEDLEQLKILEHGHKIKISIVKDVDISIDILDDIAQFKKYLCQSSISL